VMNPILPPSMKTTSAAPASGDPDDEATLFTTFSVLYLGFFGITCLVYPSIHAADGPFTNPLAYWTTISPSTAFAFRMFGGVAMSLIFGPFLDEIFGGVGVKMMAFTRQLVIVNLIFFVFFCYFAYYAPLATAIGWIWKVQAGFGAFVLGWNIVEAFTTPACRFWYGLITALQFTMFGVTLGINGDLFWGESNPIYGDAFMYFSDYPALAMVTSRSLGVSMVLAFALGYYFYGFSNGYLKLCTVWNIAVGVMAVEPAYFGGSSAGPAMWMIQVALQITLATIGLYLELSGANGPWSFAFALPKWGLNAETFNFVNFIFYLPFCVAFAVDPNAVFGPNGIGPIPFFTEDMGETALWFGRTWAAMIFLLTISPYAFAFPAIKVVKTFVVAYFTYTGLFIWWILTVPVFNLTMAIPLGSLNFIFFIFALVVALPGNSGEPML